jgi:hypothetical protein
MLRTLALAFVLYASMAGASAQEPNAGKFVPREVREAQAQQQAERERLLAIQAAQEAERVAQERILLFEAAKEDKILAVMAARGQQLWTDEQFERSVFQDGSALRARQRLLSQLTMELETIDRACRLTDAQKKKLQLAGRGEVKRFFDGYERAKQKSQLAGHDEQTFQEIQKDIFQIQRDIHRVFFQGGQLRPDSLLAKSLRNTLTSEQLTRYEALIRGSASRQR